MDLFLPLFTGEIPATHRESRAHFQAVRDSSRPLCGLGRGKAFCTERAFLNFIMHRPFEQAVYPDENLSLRL